MMAGSAALLSLFDVIEPPKPLFETFFDADDDGEAAPGVAVPEVIDGVGREPALVRCKLQLPALLVEWVTGRACRPFEDLQNP